MVFNDARTVNISSWKREHSVVSGCVGYISLWRPSNSVPLCRVWWNRMGRTTVHHTKYSARCSLAEENSFKEPRIKEPSISKNRQYFCGSKTVLGFHFGPRSAEKIRHENSNNSQPAPKELVGIYCCEGSVCFVWLSLVWLVRLSLVWFVYSTDKQTIII